MRQRVVILTRPTAKQSYIQRYGSEGQTKFAMAQSLRGRADFAKAEVEDTAQSRAVSRIRKALPSDVKLAEIDRGMVAQFLFEPHDLIVAVGQDGLVANVGKYLDGQPIAGVNPDPQTIDGSLLAFNVDTFIASLKEVLNDRRPVRDPHPGRVRPRELGRCRPDPSGRVSQRHKDRDPLRPQIGVHLGLLPGIDLLGPRST